MLTTLRLLIILLNKKLVSVLKTEIINVGKV